jgi:hypothetical protein
VPTLLKLLAVKDKMIDALLREKMQAASASALPSPSPPPSTLHAGTQTLLPTTTSTPSQCDLSACFPAAADAQSLLHSVFPLSSAAPRTFSGITLRALIPCSQMPIFSADVVRFNEADVSSVRAGSSSSSDDDSCNRAHVQALSSAYTDCSSGAAAASAAASSLAATCIANVHASVSPFKVCARVCNQKSEP